jgi:hypothetical protein
MNNFRQFDRATGFLLPPSLDEWLPEQHLARFVVEVIDGLDLSAIFSKLNRSIRSRCLAHRNQPRVRQAARRFGAATAIRTSPWESEDGDPSPALLHHVAPIVMDSLHFGWLA